MTIKKAILPVAGLGTRFLPASKAIPKEMITVVDKPVIQYVVEEAVSAGIREIVLVTHSAKRAIEDHFDVNYELESELERRGKDALLQVLRSIVPPDVRIISVRQGQALGLGHAVLCAQEVVGNEDFAVLLPDVLVDDAALPAGSQPDLALMCERFSAGHGAQVMVEQVPMENVSSYGVVALQGTAPAAGESQPVTALVEKPARADAPSDLAVVGRYVLPARIFALLRETRPGAGNEIQLTDAIASLLKEQPVEAYRMLGNTYDCGSKTGYMQATLAYGLRHPEVGEPLAALIRQHAAEIA
ncbi:UTP--glucose-1-phosphate uridylyltransferase GalU [Halopseudomonas salegens]|uniref:UTP--glucose-1-phosphate uridylyltransferase n=1 Tax=Halopseudomonas salegens TaxID=1434072 RepID=A0A1H2FKL2_9GAMM|nr:UTP--glucose-1-phosphate uridylyltransferase GalU [Halopseudomonas salegens]SDU07855.1 UTP--glucose-1-phosphate uridylyltransferase [Halopseudomonas salegens]